MPEIYCIVLLIMTIILCHFNFAESFMINFTRIHCTEYTSISTKNTCIQYLTPNCHAPKGLKDHYTGVVKCWFDFDSDLSLFFPDKSCNLQVS